jgi:hypothetical protein
MFHATGILPRAMSRLSAQCNTQLTPGFEHTNAYEEPISQSHDVVFKYFRLQLNLHKASCSGD